MKIHKLRIKSYIIDSTGITISFYRGFKMHFVSKLVDYIKRNVYYNSTGKYYNSTSNFDEVLDKVVIAISNNDDMSINQTRPLTQTENQKYRDSDEWKQKKLAVYDRDKGICQCCGKVFTDLSYEVHHRDYYGDTAGEDYHCGIDKLILVCRGCHQSFHSKYTN